MAEQSCATAVSEDELKKETGEFDLEAITFLDLSDRGLAQLGAVPLCRSLRVLNLSCNQLSSVGELSVLVALEELDISANQITALDGFEQLERLQRLDLPGNNISLLDALLPLCGLIHLRSLCLQLLGTSLSNPVCSEQDYAEFMAISFPCLVWLDGERVEGEGEKVKMKRKELDTQLERLEAVGREGMGEGEENTRALAEEEDPLAHFSLNDHQAMGKITRLLSECSHTSRKVQEHIESLQRDLLS